MWMIKRRWLKCKINVYIRFSFFRNFSNTNRLYATWKMKWNNVQTSDTGNFGVFRVLYYIHRKRATRGGALLQVQVTPKQPPPECLLYKKRPTHQYPQSHHTLPRIRNVNDLYNLFLFYISTFFSLSMHSILPWILWQACHVAHFISNTTENPLPIFWKNANVIMIVHILKTLIYKNYKNYD